MALYICEIEVMKQGADCSQQFVRCQSDSLVPGDIIKVPEGIVLPCDLVLLTGSAIVNEAILTGESIPVMKTSIPIVHTEVY